MSESPAEGVLGSVRRLEGELEAVSATRAAAEARLDEARAAASALLAEARKSASAAVAERRRLVLSEVEADVAEISRQGQERAARVRDDARAGAGAAVEAALALLLPAAGERGV